MRHHVARTRHDARRIQELEIIESAKRALDKCRQITYTRPTWVPNVGMRYFGVLWHVRGPATKRLVESRELAPRPLDSPRAPYLRPSRRAAPQTPVRPTGRGRPFRCKDRGPPVGLPRPLSYLWPDRQGVTRVCRGPARSWRLLRLPREDQSEHPHPGDAGNLQRPAGTERASSP